MTLEHEVDVLADEALADYGWQCLTCGAESATYPTLAAAEADAERHRMPARKPGDDQ